MKYMIVFNIISKYFDKMFHYWYATMVERELCEYSGKLVSHTYLICLGSSNKKKISTPMEMCLGHGLPNSLSCISACRENLLTTQCLNRYTINANP